MLYPVFYERFQVCLYLEGTHSPCIAAHVLLISFIRFFSFLFYAFSMVRSGFVSLTVTAGLSLLFPYMQANSIASGYLII